MRKKRVMTKNNGNYIAVDTVPSVDWSAFDPSLGNNP